MLPKNLKYQNLVNRLKDKYYGEINYVCDDENVLFKLKLILFLFF